MLYGRTPGFILLFSFFFRHLGRKHALHLTQLAKILKILPYAHGQAAHVQGPQRSRLLADAAVNRGSQHIRDKLHDEIVAGYASIGGKALKARTAFDLFQFAVHQIVHILGLIPQRFHGRAHDMALIDARRKADNGAPAGVQQLRRAHAVEGADKVNSVRIRHRLRNGGGFRRIFNKTHAVA